jgi:hypothetical protein
MIIGACLIIGGFSLFTISQHMWWNIPISSIPSMRPMEGFDYVMFTMTPILPIIGFSGIIVLIIGISSFLHK